MRIFLGVIALLTLRLAAAAADSPHAPSTPKPIYTRQNEFLVPFVMDPAEPGARRAVEVQLHVSEHGGPWKLYAKAPPTSGSIHFRATRDGEYRFMVRTKDDHGELQPVGPPHPELVVVLDTDPPVLEMIAERGAGSEVRARWRVRDAHLRPDSLRLEYQVGPDGPWTQVAIDLPAIGATTSAREATWIPEARTVPIMVRAEVSDLAGNVAKTQRPVPGLRPKPDATAGNEGSAQRAQENSITRWPGEKTQDIPLRSGDPPAMPGRFPSTIPSEQMWAGNRNRSMPVAEEISPGEMLPRAETLPAPTPEPVLAQPSRDRALPVPRQPEEVGLPPSEADARRPAPRTRNEVDSIDGPRLPWLAADPAGNDPLVAREAPHTGGVAQVPAEPLPPGVNPRMINTRRIELDYDVESAGPAEVRKVEVWGTKDGGQTWAKYGSDDDNRSPAIVTVEDEGTYGFRIVVENTAGLRDEPPKPGDPPDILIGVDTTKPVARFTGAALGTGNQAGTLSINWEARDKTLSPRPISLLFSPQPSGPWSTIALDLENTGHFDWQPDVGGPDRAYLRLEVRDPAGNIEVVDTPEPVPLAPARPKGHIRGVRPVAGAPPPSAPPTWQEYRR